MAQWSENLARYPPGYAYPHHIRSINMSTDLPKEKKNNLSGGYLILLLADRILSRRLLCMLCYCMLEAGTEMFSCQNALICRRRFCT